jgi:hypothetical protein
VQPSGVLGRTEDMRYFTLLIHQDMPDTIVDRPNIVEQFILEHCHYVPGAMIPYKEFCDRMRAVYGEKMPQPLGKIRSSRPRVQELLPSHFPFGVFHSNQRFIGNISWTPDAPLGAKLVVKDGKLKPCRRTQK